MSDDLVSRKEVLGALKNVWVETYTGKYWEDGAKDILAALEEFLAALPAIPLDAAAKIAAVCQLCLDHENEVAELRAALTAVEDWAIADFNEELLGFLKTFKSVPVLETPPPPIETSITMTNEASRRYLEEHGYGAPVEPVPARRPHYFVQEEDEPVATCLHCGQTDDGEETPNCAPVPAPRLEWERIENCDRECSQTPHLRGAQFKVHHNGTFVTMTFSGSLDLPTDDAAKSLAEKLNALLSPPVGPQPTKGN